MRGLPGLLPPGDPAGARGADRALLWLAALAPLALAFAARDLWSPDEPRYAQVAREMLRDGRWLVPHVNGAPYAEKPPLFFAAVAALSAPFGEVTALAARLVGALFAGGGVLLVARLGRLWFGDRALGTTAALLFGTTAVVGWNASRAGLDLPLTFFVLAAAERLSVWAATGSPAAAALGGLAWAGAVLVKGPMGLFVPVLATAGGLLAARRAPRRSDPGWWLAPLVLAAVGLAWLLPALASGGEAYRARLLGQIGDRVSGEERGHVRPWHYYLVRILPLALPWTAHLLAAAGTAFGIRRRPEAERYGLGACAAGGFGTLLILTVVATKREVYMIPALAFGALAAAYVVHRGLLPALARPALATALGTLVALAVASAGGLFVAPAWFAEPFARLVRPSDLSLLLPTLAASLVFGAGAAALWRLRAAPAAGIRAATVSLLAGSALVLLTYAPVVDPVLSWRRAARAAEEAVPGAPVVEHGIWQPGVMLWSFPRERIASEGRPAELARLLDPAAPPVLVVAEARAWERAVGEAPALAAARVVWRDRVSHRTVVIATNAPTGPR